ncbi:MAG TPA: maleylpyruvate isomerase family mycothiol-dependent enzyme [Ornithinibacter sp.]|nr:maleylpyruvate isomerase family mycothiol-dependent enzyme [Ornithinibacter sp.]
MTHRAPTVELHLHAIVVAADVLSAHARDAGPEAAVPTCPGWTVRDLVAHQGMVHRWATAIVRGQDPRTVDDTEIEAQGRAHPDPVAWLESGATDLVRALAAAPADLDVMTFLREAPPARAFWARRQCHETTVHALDAVATTTPRALTAADVWLDATLCTDGIDELLVGFWQRRTKGPRSEIPYAAAVSVVEGPSWLLEIGPEHPVTRRLGDANGIPVGARPLSGSPADLYLALWNRGGEVDDTTGLLLEWREPGAVTW